MVENCVVLGLGSLGSGSAAGSAAGPGAARKSLLQLAALEDLLGCLSAWGSFLYLCLSPSPKSVDGRDYLALLTGKEIGRLAIPGAQRGRLRARPGLLGDGRGVSGDAGRQGARGAGGE